MRTVDPSGRSCHEEINPQFALLTQKRAQCAVNFWLWLTLSVNRCLFVTLWFAEFVFNNLLIFSSLCRIDNPLPSISKYNLIAHWQVYVYGFSKHQMTVNHIYQLRLWWWTSCVHHHWSTSLWCLFANLSSIQPLSSLWGLSAGSPAASPGSGPHGQRRRCGAHWGGWTCKLWKLGVSQYRKTPKMVGLLVKKNEL